MLRLVPVLSLLLLSVQLSLSAQQPIRPVLSEVNELRPLNLERMNWWLVDSEDVTPQQLKRPDERVRLIGNLAITGAAGWLLTEFQLPKLSRDPAIAERFKNTMTSVMTLGGAEGNATVFFNETQVGEHQYVMGATTPTPSRFVIPTDALRWGETNYLAIRIEPVAGEKLLKVTAPLVLSPLGPYELQENIETIRERLGLFYRSLYRGQKAQLDRSAEFALLANSLSELEATFAELRRQFDVGASNISKILQDMNDLLDGNEQRRFLLETKALTRLHAENRQLATEFANELKVDPNEVRIRPEGFGRFGYLKEDGLPGLRAIGPTNVSPVRGHGLKLHVGNIERTDVMDIDWSHKVSRVVALQDRTATQGRQVRFDELLLIYYQYASSLFPGTMFDVLAGREITFEIPYNGSDVAIYQYAVLGPDYSKAIYTRYLGSGARSKSAQEKRAQRQMIERLRGEPRISLIIPRVKNAVPLLLVHQNESVMRLRRIPGREQGSLLDVATNAPALGRLVVIYPLGISTLDASPRDKEDPEMLPQRLLGEDYQDFLAAFYRYGARFPYKVDEVYYIDESNQQAYVKNRFRYRFLNDDWRGGAYPAILPPQLNQARLDGYPMMIDEGFRMRLSLPGPEGLFYAGEKDTNTIRYQLPLPPLHERALPATQQEGWFGDLFGEALQAALEQPVESNVPLAKSNYPARNALYQAYSFLPQDARQQLHENDGETLDDLLNPAMYKERREPFSSIKSSWRSARIGPYYSQYDESEDLALALHTIQQQVAYNGDWARLEESKELLEDGLWKNLMVTDDWGWMQPGYAQHGGGTGMANTANTVYLGARAYARLMTQLGDKAQADQARLMMARMGLVLHQRFISTEYAVRNRFIKRDEMAVGFQEGYGFVSADTSRYPWPMLSMLDAHGLSPALFDYYLSMSPELLKRFMKRVELEFPNWYTGDALYEYQTPMRGHPGQITMPMIYGLARMGAPQNLLLDYTNEASRERDGWWMAPPVLAELASGQEGVWLQSWDRLQFRGAELKNGRLTTNFMVLKTAADQQQQVQIRLPNKPHGVYLNDQRVTRTNWIPSRSTLQVFVPAQEPGAVRLVVDVEKQAPPLAAQPPKPAPALIESISIIAPEAEATAPPPDEPLPTEPAPDSSDSDALHESAPEPSEPIASAIDPESNEITETNYPIEREPVSVPTNTGETKTEATEAVSTNSDASESVQSTTQPTSQPAELPPIVWPEGEAMTSSDASTTMPLESSPSEAGDLLPAAQKAMEALDVGEGVEPEEKMIPVQSDLVLPELDASDAMPATDEPTTPTATLREGVEIAE